MIASRQANRSYPQQVHNKNTRARWQLHIYDGDSIKIAYAGGEGERNGWRKKRKSEGEKRRSGGGDGHFESRETPARLVYIRAQISRKGRLRKRAIAWPRTHTHKHTHIRSQGAFEKRFSRAYTHIYTCAQAYIESASR